MKRDRLRLFRLVILGAIALSGLTACSSFGPDRISPDRFDYNEAISRSSNEQMLLNLVRLRYRDAPVFLNVSSVLTQYIYSGALSINGTAGEAQGSPAYSVGGGATGLYIERPTLTYSPLTGEDYAYQLLSPIPSDLIFGLVQSGWPAGPLLAMSLQRVNSVESLPFQSHSTQSQLARQQRFRRMVSLLIELAGRDALEIQRNDENVGASRHLVFADSNDPEVLAQIGELKGLLSLDANRSDFRLTQNVVRRDPDEITVVLRSMLTLVGHLSRGVEVPPKHIAENPTAENERPEDGGLEEFLFPLRVQSSAERPGDAFVAVQYQDFWFYILHSDQRSKQTFGLLLSLFQLQSPKSPSTAPVLTVPTG